MGGDFGVGILGFEGLFGLIQCMLAALDEYEVLHAGFGEGGGDGEADTHGCEVSVCLGGRWAEIWCRPPAVISTVLPRPSNVLDGEMRS